MQQIAHIATSLRHHSIVRVLSNIHTYYETLAKQRIRLAKFFIQLAKV